MDQGTGESRLAGKAEEKRALVPRGTIRDRRNGPAASWQGPTRWPGGAREPTGPAAPSARPLTLVRDRETALPPPARPWAARFISALVEVMVGARPVSQLARWMTEETYAVVHGHVRRHRHLLTGRRVDALAAGQVTGRAATKSIAQRPAVRSVHVSTPRADVTEACALIVHRERGRALALRFEARDGRWLCTAVEFG
ncbi:MAG: Rv3235 family protein [Streptosporangiaceae bacterium]